jgi:transcriptional regulator GlxA family with amidase domain
MENQEYEKQIEELKRRVDVLQRTNLELVNRNLQLGQQIDAYYDVRRRIQMLKDLVIRHKELMRQADLRDDDELMALMEARLEEDFPHENPDFGLKELAEFLGTSQTRLIDLFRRSPIHNTAADYLDYMRLLRSLYYLQSKPQWGIAACAQEAGFTVIRTYNRKFQDALGMTPHDFRELIEAGREQGKQQDI